MSEQKVRVVVFEGERYRGDWPGDTLQDVITWFSYRLEEIHPNYRAIAKCEIDCEGGYDSSHYPRIKIFYDRLETADEAKYRHDRESNYKRDQDFKEKSELRRLLAKHGSPD